MIQYFGHPFSSYTWKGEIALIEKGADYVFRPIDGGGHPENVAALTAIWPVQKFPVLEHGDIELFEASIIVEYVDRLSEQGPALIPQDAAAALRVRLLDRVFDNHVMGQVQAVVNEHLPFIAEPPDEGRIARARATLSKVYAWLEGRLPDDGWAAGGDFTLADCAAAPALFYADWVHEVPSELTRLRGYRARLLARASVTQVVDAARPYRHLFPLGAPDRD